MGELKEIAFVCR